MPAIMAGAASGSALPSALSLPIITSWRLPLEPSMMVTVFGSPLAAGLAADFGAGIGDAAAAVGAAFSSPLALLADRDMRGRLAAERIVAEDGKAGKGHQEQAEQHGQRLQCRKWQPEPTFPAHRLLSERGAQIVGRLSHEPFPNQRRRRYHGTARRRTPAIGGALEGLELSKQKGRP